MKKRYLQTACMALFTIGIITAAHFTTENNIHYDDLKPIPALTANFGRNKIKPQKSVTKTVTLSENAETKEICCISGQDELTVKFASTRGPQRVYVAVSEENALISDKELELQDSLLLSIDPKKNYTIEASLHPYTDYGSGGKVTFEIT